MHLGVRLLRNSTNKYDVINTININGEWYINEGIELAYLSACPSKSVPSNTDTDIDDDDDAGAEIGDDVWSVVDALTLLQVPMKSSLFTEDRIYDVQGAFLKVLARRRHQKPILLGRCETGEPVDYWIFDKKTERSEYTPMKFYIYDLRTHRMIENKGFDLKKNPSLNLGKGVCTLLPPIVQKEWTLAISMKPEKG